MNVPSKIMAFRNERASEIEALARLIEKTNIGSPHQIYTAAQSLRDEKCGFHTPGTTDYSCWGYTIEDLKLYLPELPRHVAPKSIHSLDLTIDIDLLCKCDDWDNLNDPFQKLNFRVALRGLDSVKEYSFGFHIDKHNHAHQTDEIHPIYHLQYSPALRNQATDYGSLLMLDTPRMMHAPVDLVLGLDLVLSNFLPKVWDKLRDEQQYVALYKKYLDSIWKPYVHTWASHWAYDLANITWQPSLLCPYLLN